MMNTTIKAGAEEFIWIIVGVFWVIAQIAGASKKKPNPPRPMDEEERELATDPFSDLMRKFAGVQEITAPTPPKPVEILEKKDRSERLAPLTESKFIGRAKPNRREPFKNPATPEPVRTVPKVDIRPTMSSFRSIMPAMKLPTMNLSFQTSEKSAQLSPMLGNIINPADKQTLRRAMLSHIIFSPPKALENWNSGMIE